MKKNMIVLFLGIASLLFTGCIEVFQYVSITDGQVDVTVKYLIQKSVIEMGASFSDEEVDYDDILGDGEELFDNLDDLKVHMSQIHTPLEIGYEIRLQGSLNEIQSLSEDELLLFVPEKVNGSYHLIIPGMGSDNSDDMGFGFAFLASSKYRILVDLSGDLAGITNARLIASNMNTEIDFDMSDVVTTSIYGSNMMIEIPMIIPFTSEDNLMVELY